MTPVGSVEAVVLAVQEDAEAEVEKIERDLATAVARLRDEDRALPVVVPDADARIAEARRHARDRIAAEDWTDHQTALSNRESWIERVIAEADRKLQGLDPAILRADLVDLVRQALERMPNQPLELLVSAGQIDLAETMLRDGTLARSGKTFTRVRATSEVTSGCIVQTGDGRIRYENSYKSRARRFETAWRARLGELYERRLDPALAAGAASRRDTT